MSDPSPPRRPRVFSADDPHLTIDPAPLDLSPSPAPGQTQEPDPRVAMDYRTRFKRGLSWGGMFFSAMVSLTLLGLGVWYTRFISATLARDDWIGWTGMALLAIAGLAATVILVREILGFLRIGRMARVRKDADSAIRQNDAVLARRSLAALRTTFAGRPEMTWGLNRLTEHERGIHDAADLLRLAERDLLVPIDADARRAVVQSAKRIATVTALSPMATLTIGFVMAENLRMLRRLATLYGGRPGMLGGLRLARLVVMHIILTGGMALTDDLLGQFLGQDLARRLSRRLGEGVFNGTLAARVGTAAIDVCRPLPFIDAPALRLRDLVTEIFKRGT